MKMPTAHRIALLFNGNKIYDRDIIAGIAAYLNTTRVSWDLFLPFEVIFITSKVSMAPSYILLLSLPSIRSMCL